MSATSTPALPIVAVADLHGHRTTFERLLAHWDAALRGDYRLVLLGDYVDNGPEIPALLDLLVELQRTRAGRFHPIMGNHDLACLRAMGWDGGPSDEAWFDGWLARFGGGSTARAYGARSGSELSARMPAHHRTFLQGLPWYLDDDQHVFVHAGLERGPLDPQLRALDRRPLLDRQYTVAPLRDKRLATVSYAAWTRTVVSGHTNRPCPGEDRHAPHWVDDRRITLSAEVDHGGLLWSVLLPERRFVGVDAYGGVSGRIDGRPTSYARP